MNSQSLRHLVTIPKEHTYELHKFVIDPNDYNKQQIVDYIKNLYNTNPSFGNKFFTCWQTDYDLHYSSNILDTLIDILNKKANSIIQLKRGYKLKVVETWASVYKQGDTAEMHGHGRHCHYSAVLYLETSEGHPPLTFEDGYVAPCNQDCLYIFNSQYRHYVPPSQLDSLRIVLGINLYILPPSHQ